MFGQYKRLTNKFEAGVLTGKGLVYGGSQVRTEATGYGCTYFVEEMLKAKKNGFKGKTVVVSGSGNVAIYTLEKVHQLGGKVVAMSDSNGYMVDEKGFNLETVKTLKEVERRADQGILRLPQARQVHPGREHLGRAVRRRDALRHPERARRARTPGSW